MKQPAGSGRQRVAPRSIPRPLRVLALLVAACSAPTQTAPGSTLAEPFVVMTSPKRQQGVSPRPDLVVEGVAYGPVETITLTHDTAQIPIVSGKRWHASVVLHEGDNLLEAVATTKDGRVARDSRTIVHYPGARLGPLEWTPHSLMVGDGPTLLSITHVGGQDPLDLVAVDALGKAQGAALAALKDDGTGGDAVAGDDVFSARVALDTAAPKTHRLRARVASSGALSEVAEIHVAARPSEAALDERDQVEEEAAGWLRDAGWLRGGADVDKAADVALARLRSDPRVRWAELAPGKQSLSFATAADIPSVIFLKVPVALPAQQGKFPLEEGEWPPHTRIGSNDVVMLAPFAWETPEHIPNLNRLFRNTFCPSFEPEVYSNADASLAVFRSSLHHRGVMVFDTHGAFVRLAPHSLYNPSATPLGTAVIGTGEEYTKAKRAELLAEIGFVMAGRLDPRAGSKMFFLVTTKFFEHYARDNDHSLVWMGACDSLVEQSLAAAFMTSGTAFFVGFIDPYPDYVAAVGDAFFEALLSDGDATWPAYLKALQTAGAKSGVGALGDPGLKVAGSCKGYTRATFELGGATASSRGAFLSVDEIERDGNLYYLKQTRETCSFQARAQIIDPVFGLQSVSTGAGAVSWVSTPGETLPVKLLFGSDGAGGLNLSNGARLDVRTEALATPWLEVIHTATPGGMQIEKTTCSSLGDVSFELGVDAFVSDREIRGYRQTRAGSASSTIEFRYRL